MSLYGVDPLAIEAFFEDFKAKYPDMSSQDTMMAINWLKQYQSFQSVETGWKRCKEHIGPTVKDNVEKIASMKDIKIRFGEFEGEEDCRWGELHH